MKLFQGMSGSAYQDVLRAIGALIDERGYTDIRIIEVEAGLVLQGRTPRRTPLGEANYETYLITEEDVQRMVREAYFRRQRRASPPPPPSLYSQAEGVEERP
ncbi:MAG TPA: hypothetical protein VFS21_22905 [Roseiflexaceae bacterium]|nr:hypothetical protein [Roseiflexaceae bacterium]